MKNVMITAPAHPLLLDGLKQKGYSVIYAPDITYAQLGQEIESLEGLVVTTRIRIDAPLLNAAKALKWIGRLGSGMELIDVNYAAQKGIVCISTPEGNCNAVAEHSLALILNGLNHITRSFNQVKGGLWLRNENRGTELSGKTVGVMGYGNTGSSFVRLLASFNVTVLVYDKYRKGFEKGYIKEASLEQLQKEAQIISLHLPLTQETKHFANEAFFSELQQSPFFISTCRGGVTCTQALLQAIESGKISGAALDVLENEKPGTYTPFEKEQLRLLAENNVVITPHIAGYSYESYKKMAVALLGKL